VIAATGARGPGKGPLTTERARMPRIAPRTLSGGAGNRGKRITAERPITSPMFRRAYSFGIPYPVAKLVYFRGKRLVTNAWRTRCMNGAKLAEVSRAFYLGEVGDDPDGSANSG
jgi:hypothetical protein